MLCEFSVQSVDWPSSTFEGDPKGKNEIPLARQDEMAKDSSHVEITGLRQDNIGQPEVDYRQRDYSLRAIECSQSTVGIIPRCSSGRRAY